MPIENKFAVADIENRDHYCRRCPEEERLRTFFPRALPIKRDRANASADVSVNLGPIGSIGKHSHFPLEALTTVGRRIQFCLRLIDLF